MDFTNVSEDVLNLMPGAVVLLHADESICCVNEAMWKLYDCQSKQEFLNLIGASFRGMVMPEDCQSIGMMVEKSVHQSGSVTEERLANYSYLFFCIRTKIGRIRHVEGSIRRVCFHGKWLWSLLLVDAHVRFRAVEHDALTTLMGRHLFFSRASEREAADRAEGIFGRDVLAYFNLTNFKHYNAMYGAERGDDCLRRIAAVLREGFPDSLLARMSADIFLALIPADDAQSRIEKVVQKVNGLLKGEHAYLHAGIRYFSAQENVSISMACDQAKAACDSIKRERGRAYCVFSEHLRQELAVRSYVIAHIDEAVENGYIEIYYQPVVRTLTGNLAGMEALARWHDPVYGFLRPNQFIPVLEEERLIDKLDRYVIRECGRQLRRQMDAHQPIVPISFNVSRMDFQLMDVLSEIESVVRENGLPRDCLRIEITETAMVQDRNRILEMIDRFRGNGYPVWLDDFGSGYSSLNVLKDYHFDELKIDMEFLRVFNDTSRKIITSVVMMAKAIGIHTLAEGVETREQVEFLRSIGCEKLQGYYYGRPMPYDELVAHCRERHLCAETRQEERIYGEAGLFNVIRVSPVALFLDDGKELYMAYENDAYQKVMMAVGISSRRAVNQVICSLDDVRRHKMRAYADRVTRNRPCKVSETFLLDGRRLRVRAKTLAGLPGFHIHMAEIVDLTRDADSI